MPPAAELPSSLSVERRGDVALVTVKRAHRRNALDDPTIVALGEYFSALPEWVKVTVLAGEGEHFSAGLDLAELSERDAVGGLHHSRMWHRALASIESGVVPVIAVLKGAVIGGGLELAAAAHIRIAEETTFFALPEGQRGLFVGGGASVRVPRLIGTHRMVDMMLTGRVLSASEGATQGLAQYLVPTGAGLEKALEVAGRIAANSALTNYAVLQALPRIAEAAPDTGFLMESMMAAIAQSSPDAKERMRDFLEGRAAKVAKSGSEQ